jgi:hypothetical protein
LKKDPFEQANLIGTSSGDNAVAAFRKRLFDVLTANPGSIEVETAYLKTFKRELESQMREIEERQVAAGN